MSRSIPLQVNVLFISIYLPAAGYFIHIHTWHIGFDSVEK